MFFVDKGYNQGMKMPWRIWPGILSGHLFLKDEEVIKKILKRLGLWDVKACPPSFWRARPPSRANAPPKAPEYYIDYTDPQLPVSDTWLYVDPEYLSQP